MGYAQWSQTSAPIVFSQNLQSKGFGGGVPPNTETAAVKPRVGIEWITKRCLFFVEMARAGRIECTVLNAECRILPALTFFRA
jgi:hypothetical protein